MFKNLIARQTAVVTLLAAMAMAPAAWAAQSAEVAGMLDAADGYRNPNSSSRVELDVELFSGDNLDKTKSYRVYSSIGRRALVIFKTPGEAGQKALQLDERFYILMPRARRPIRITPMQKLLGEAAIGDVSSMTWSEDYEGVLEDSQAQVDGKLCVKLRLTARRDGVTYHTVELYLSAQDNFPVKAELYMKSGKLAKTAIFHEGTVSGAKGVTRMTLLDKIQKNKRTEVMYRSIENHNPPEKYFNASYLAKNNVD